MLDCRAAEGEMAIIEADAVFQGGGVKGLALAGALLEFAEPGDVSISRWQSVAGTSAGAIIAAYLACGHDAEDLAELLHRIPYAKFQDWGPGGKLLGGGLNLLRFHGLAHGEYFRRWFDEQLHGATFRSVRQEDAEATEGPYRLKIIAADVTRREMLVLPDDLPSYRLPEGDQPIDVDSFRIADAVRMSMSIPYFFQPVELVHHSTNKPSTIVDGGIVSNFPVWLFDVADRPPARPTFGFRLVGGRGLGSGLQPIMKGPGWPLQLGSEIFQTSSDAWDKRFMSHSTAVRTCLVHIGDIGTTDFDLTAQQQQELLDWGRTSARRFLDEFDIGRYRNTFGRQLPSPVTS